MCSAKVERLKVKVERLDHSPIRRALSEKAETLKTEKLKLSRVGSRSRNLHYLIQSIEVDVGLYLHRRRLGSKRRKGLPGDAGEIQTKRGLKQ